MTKLEVLDHLLAFFPRAVAGFDAVSLHVSGTWSGLLVQLVYSRRDPSRPGQRTTLVAAHHPDLGLLSYEVVDGDGLLTIDEWADGTPRRTGIWWTTATAGSTHRRREGILWHDVLPVLEQVDTLAAAERVAEHLNTPLSADVGRRPPRVPGPRDGMADDTRMTCEADRLERLLAVVDGVVSGLAAAPDGTPALRGASPPSPERPALAGVVVDDADVGSVSRELLAARTSVDAALHAVRAARDRATPSTT